MTHFADQEKYDEVFMQIAGQIGSVQGVLDNFFGFMHRKTDFYVQYENDQTDAKMGFPVGVAEKMVLNSFRKHKMKDYASQVKDMSQASPKNQSSGSEQIEDSKVQIIPEVATALPVISSTAASSSNSKAISLNSKGQQTPIGNGGVADNYYWTQTLTEVTVYVDAEHATRGKEIDCTINPKYFKLSVLGNVLIEGEFEEAVRVDESMWTLNIGNVSNH